MLAPRRIVIVEDNDDLRIMQQQLLQLAGHDVQTATTGPAGIAKILVNAPDVAFVDLGLPGCDGFEVARRRRSCAKRAALNASHGDADLHEDAASVRESS